VWGGRFLRLAMGGPYLYSVKGDEEEEMKDMLERRERER
jgi:hypothetical protein